MAPDLRRNDAVAVQHAPPAPPAPSVVASVAPRVTWLIDNAEAYEALLAACRSARSSIWMTQLAFDADCVAYPSSDDSSRDPDVAPARVIDVLIDAAERRNVDVRILLNASLLLDTAAPLRRYLATRGCDPLRVRVRGIRRFPQLLHAKIVVVDGEVAFLVGSPFVNGYWDDSQHVPQDARRPSRELGGRPLHDLSIRLTGDAAATLAHGVAELWNGADDVDTDDTHVLAVPSPVMPADAPVQIVRSAPAARRAGHPVRRADIIGALLAGISSAHRSIYIEHQYLSSAAVINALVGALARRPLLEIIIVLNQNPDVTAYRGWQNRRLAASGLFDHERVGLFALWTVGGAGARCSVVNQVFVHSKVVVIDDRWAMVGSANLDGVSLETYADDFASWIGQRVFRGVRNFDVAAIVAGGVGSHASDSVRELRVALWREHLDAPDLDGTAPPSDGWLAHWRRCAHENVRRLNGGALQSGIMVLAYSRSSTPARQLRDAGVDLAKQCLTIDFDPSWMEVHLSPNWVRNMFA